MCTYWSLLIFFSSTIQPDLLMAGERVLDDGMNGNMIFQVSQEKNIFIGFTVGFPNRKHD